MLDNMSSPARKESYRQYRLRNRLKVAARRKVDPEYRRHLSEVAKASAERVHARDPKRAWAKTACKNARRRAELRGLPFDLAADELMCPDKCPALGVSLSYDMGKGRGGRWFSPSLDRVIPERGYVKGNVRVISKKANTIKSNASADELERVLAYVREVA